MTTPVRVQLRRAKGWRMPENTVVVARPSRWGNPCIVGYHGTRAECVYWFRLAMAGSIVLGLRAYQDGGSVADALLAYYKMAKRDRRHLRGRNLACWCRLCEAHSAGRPLGVHCGDCAPCHVDVLLEIANR